MQRQESIGRWISVLFRQLQIHLNRELEIYHISISHLQILIVLYKNDSINQEAISKILNYDKATIGRAVNKLIKEDYVKREIDPTDRRAYNLHLTDKGKLLEPELRQILKNSTSILLKDFSIKEREMAFELLQKMYENIINNQINQ
jgi:DNA-binding MarR family transcriptional regulator